MYTIIRKENEENNNNTNEQQAKIEKRRKVMTIYNKIIAIADKITDDFTILGYPAEFRLMNRQGFNQVITTKDILNPFKTNERINQPACAIVLWRRHTNEPITEKIEKLS